MNISSKVMQFLVWGPAAAKDEHQSLFVFFCYFFVVVFVYMYIIIKFLHIVKKIISIIIGSAAIVPAVLTPGAPEMERYLRYWLRAPLEWKNNYLEFCTHSYILHSIIVTL